MNNLLTVPGSKFKLKNDNNIYQFYGYNNNNILYRLVDNIINFNFSITIKQNVSEVIQEPILLQKYHIRIPNQ